MKVKALLLIVALASCLQAAETPERFYAEVERHLRSLPTLEVEYHAEGLAFGDSGMVGYMYWLRPNYFLHNTQEWMHCDTRTEQWRYLKAQNTLIRENSQDRSDWLPESILLDVSVKLTPKELTTTDDGRRVLTLKSDSPQSPGIVYLRFEPTTKHPFEIEFSGDDGSGTLYRITQWKENSSIDSHLFVPPVVPAENLIDFRTTGDKE
jgi:outer membrane lipoprotein-sorting protein